MGKSQKPVAWSPIVPIRTGSASKLNGGGVIEYEVGREHQQLHIRITKNDSSGTFGKEWMGWSAVRPLLEDAKKTGQPVHSSLFRSVIASKSQNTPGFLAAALRKEGLLAATEEGSTLSNVVGDPAQWEAGMMQLSYVPVTKSSPIPGTENVDKVDDQATPDSPQTMDGKVHQSQIVSAQFEESSNGDNVELGIEPDSVPDPKFEPTPKAEPESTPSICPDAGPQKKRQRKG